MMMSRKEHSVALPAFIFSNSIVIISKTGKCVIEHVFLFTLAARKLGAKFLTHAL